MATLIRPSAKIVQICADMKQIEAIGRTCYKSEDRITDESADDFVEMIIKRGHETVIEHSLVSVRFIIDRGVSHELVRHRIASFSQESTRYCDYNKGDDSNITFIIPPWINEDCINSDWTQGSDADLRWIQAMMDAEQHYKILREQGWKPEQARSVLPNSLKTEIVMTANLREWRYFFKLRTAMAAHPQMREVTMPLLDDFHRQLPVIFKDLVM
jgi:thymidylate synthase (FAD)